MTGNGIAPPLYTPVYSSE